MNRWGDGHCSIGNTGLRVLAVLHLPDCRRAGEEQALLHFLILGKQGCPAEGLLICRKHCTSMIRCRQNLRSPLLSREGKIQVHQLGFSGAASVPGSLGWMDCVWPGHCVAGRIAKWQMPWEGSAPRRVGANFPNRKLLGQHVSSIKRLEP